MKKRMSRSESGKLGALASAKTVRLQKEKRIKEYNEAPILCGNCCAALNYEKRKNKYCNKSCAAKVNNRGVRRHGMEPNQCLSCQKDTRNPKYCSLKCHADYRWSKTKEKIEKDRKVPKSNRALKRYLLELRGSNCWKCGIVEWNNLPAPLEIEHIDGNSDNNELTNLEILCCNCHAQTPTYKGKNKGNGRHYRRTRYKEGKSY
ncbi:MAG: HNH endonuclease [Bacteroidetes bacterium]|nr:HNH endonuclease [Bacteroidota bacterium]